MNSPTVTIWKKEYHGALLHPSTWFVFAANAFFTGFIFLLALRNAATQGIGIAPLFCSALNLSIPLPVAFFTMSLFAQDRNSGVLESLLTAPVTDTEVVLGKFYSALSLSFWSILCGCLSIVAYFRIATPAPELFLLPLVGGILAVAVVATALAALGTLCSLLVRNETAAGALCFVLGFILCSVSSEDFLGIGFGPGVDRIGIINFARGIADTRPIVIFLSLTVFFLFSAVRVLESRRWASAS